MVVAAAVVVAVDDDSIIGVVNVGEGKNVFFILLFF